MEPIYQVGGIQLCTSLFKTKLSSVNMMYRSCSTVILWGTCQNLKFLFNWIIILCKQLFVLTLQSAREGARLWGLSIRVGEEITHMVEIRLSSVKMMCRSFSAVILWATCHNLKFLLDWKIFLCKGPSTYGVRWFWVILNLPTYPNQISSDLDWPTHLP